MPSVHLIVDSTVNLLTELTLFPSYRTHHCMDTLFRCRDKVYNRVEWSWEW